MCVAGWCAMLIVVMQKGGGILGAIGSHLIDSVTFITGQRITRVNAVLKTFT